MARMASGTRKRSDGSLEKRFTVNGKRYSVYGKTKKELDQREQEKREAIRNGSYADNRSITLNRFFDEWIESKQGTVSGNSIYAYTRFYNTHFRDGIGKRKVAEIESREVTRLQKSIKASPATVNYCMKLLKSIFTAAVDQEIRSANPVKVKPLKADRKAATKTKHRALTREEQTAFIDTIRGSYYQELFELLLFSGLRVGEAGALLWSDIDHKAGVIHITKTISRTAEGRYIIGSTTKTKAGQRDIPITAAIRDVLKRQRQKRRIIPYDNNLVFISQQGKLVISQTVNAAIKAAIRDTDIKPFTAHALRDTYATRYIENGGSAQVLKALLGHESYEMTMDLYSHVLQDTINEEAQRIAI